MSAHAPLDELLGAYALDALDETERRAIEEHLEQSAEARAELRQLRIAVDALGATERDASCPEGAWDRIHAAITDGPDRDLPVLHLPATARRHRPPRLVAAALALAAALVVGLGLGAAVHRGQAPSNEAAVERLADAALKDTNARVGTLAGEGTPAVRVVVEPGGHGYLFGGDLPSLPPGRTYQLWTLDGAAPVSLAVLGPNPRIVPFSAGAAATTLAITDEAAPGAAVPGSAPLAVGTLA
jgi:anti-sigma-K factor RskA